MANPLSASRGARLAGVVFGLALLTACGDGGSVVAPPTPAPPTPARPDPGRPPRSSPRARSALDAPKAVGGTRVAKWDFTTPAAGTLEVTHQLPPRRQPDPRVGDRSAVLPCAVRAGRMRLPREVPRGREPAPADGGWGPGRRVLALRGQRRAERRADRLSGDDRRLARRRREGRRPRRDGRRLVGEEDPRAVARSRRRSARRARSRRRPRPSAARPPARGARAARARRSRSGVISVRRRSSTTCSSRSTLPSRTSKRRAETSTAGRFHSTGGTTTRTSRPSSRKRHSLSRSRK